MKPRLRTLNEVVNRLADDYLSQDESDEYLLRGLRNAGSYGDDDEDKWYGVPDRDTFRDALGL
ncbi:MAG: hypothetical protein ACLTZ2_08995 [Desulfovibrio sp.]